MHDGTWRSEGGSDGNVISENDARAGGTAAPGALQPAKTESIGQWTEHTAPDGRKYYYNSVLKKSSWANPGGLAEAPTSADSAWEEHTAPDGRKYYHNKVTKESKWTLPPGVKPIAVSKLAGGPGQYLCPPGAIQMGPTPVYATSGEAKEAFRAILRDAQIPSWMGWEQAVAVISADRRFGAVRTLGERRLLFDEYMMGRKKEEEAQASERNKQVRRGVCMHTKLKTYHFQWMRNGERAKISRTPMMSVTDK